MFGVHVRVRRLMHVRVRQVKVVTFVALGQLQYFLLGPGGLRPRGRSTGRRLRRVVAYLGQTDCDRVAGARVVAFVALGQLQFHCVGQAGVQPCGGLWGLAQEPRAGSAGGKLVSEAAALEVLSLLGARGAAVCV